MPSPPTHETVKFGIPVQFLIGIARTGTHVRLSHPERASRRPGSSAWLHNPAKPVQKQECSEAHLEVKTGPCRVPRLPQRPPWPCASFGRGRSALRARVAAHGAQTWPPAIVTPVFRTPKLQTRAPRASGLRFTSDRARFEARAWGYRFPRLGDADRGAHPQRLRPLF